LAAKDYDRAMSLYPKAAHEDLAYTLLKMAENAAVRNEFDRALALNKDDETAALENSWIKIENPRYSQIADRHLLFAKRSA